MKKNFKPKKASASLRRYILLYLMGLTALVVIAYTFLLRGYFFQGLTLSSAYPMEIEARQFALAYQQDTSTPLPTSRLMTSHVGYEQLPELAQKLFPPENHEHAKLLTERWWPDEIKERTKENMHFLMLMPYALHDGQQLFMFLQFTPDYRAEVSSKQFKHFTTMIWPVAVFFLVFFLLGVLFLIRKLGKQMESISNWADELTIENKDHRPEFTYEELEHVSNKLQQAFQRIGAMLEKEHYFLRHASHELRTPIAVLRSNVELLNRAYHCQDMDERTRAPWQRIERAVNNMQHMTETLLWLSRETPIDQQTTTVSLNELIEELIEENSYLLQNKHVDLKLDLQPRQAETAITPCRIALNNLIRNAFQYTQNGFIRVEIHSEQILIENRDTQTSSESHNGSDYGFGLGLRLVEQICQQMNWQFSSEEIPGGRLVTIKF